MIQKALKVLFLVTFTVASQAQSPVITGQVQLSGTWKPTVYLERIDSLEDIFSGSSHLVVDSAAIDRMGNFMFSKKSFTNQKQLYKLIFGYKKDAWSGFINGLTEHNAFYLVLTASDKVRIKSNSDFFAKNYQVVSSTLSVNKDFEALLHDISPLLKKGSDAKFVLDKNRDNPKLDSISNVELNSLKSCHRETLFKNFNKKLYTVKSAELAAVMLCYMEYEQYLASDSESVTALVKHLYQQFPKNNFIQQAHKKLEAFSIKLAPLAIELSDTLDKKVVVSALPFKIAILDFWASWCGPCKLEAKTTLQPLYEKYKDKGLEIIGISTDESPEKWKKAVSKEKIPWVSLIDEQKKYKNLLQVKYLPTIFVINAEQKIIAKNLLGMDIVNFINRQFE